MLIALFVFRLDNRPAAQEVRNKLHGRSIRGYSGRLQVIFADEAMDPPSSPPQPHPKVNSSSNSNSKLATMYQDIYAVPQTHQQQDTNNNNVGSSGNIHSATGARRGYPNMNVNANGNDAGGGGYQSQIQSPRGVAVGDTTQPPGTGSATVPPPLQPISATLNQLQMQLETLRSLLAAYTNSNNANTDFDATSNGTTTNNGINTNSHSHNAQSQSHSNPTSPHLRSVPIPNGNSHPNFATTAASNTLNSNPNTNTNTKAFNPHCARCPSSSRERESLNPMACSYTLPNGQGQG
ncbi:hypothetical protein M422DRAFT_276550 [Sphaerobolus stellatus SS14]|uniref:RRM domain-containing protein n=1 Tax=Sphaerobolus stellatus (strain SS14) TaxID=990650 RepID=A0A0C9TMA6_SPHS4|nr:hypothetical protein M422DRAFT_276550 [Sphaerobolus stellatus SS14]